MASPPVRRRTPAKASKPGAAARVLSLVAGHPRQVLAALVLAGCGGYIAWNALVMQTARHPAPLFNHQTAPRTVMPEPVRPMPPTRPVATQPEPEAAAPAPSSAVAVNPQPSPAAAPAAPPKLPSRGAISELIRNGGDVTQPATPQRAAPVAPPAPAPAAARAPTVRDPIGEIIRMGGPVPVPPANVGQADSGSLVLAGQRALAKLGYGVKPDGVMGAGTRQAIERFEQDRRLPVTGEFGPRTARELSSLSGIAVQ